MASINSNHKTHYFISPSIGAQLAHLFDCLASYPVAKTARKADWGTSHSPTCFMRFLPSFVSVRVLSYDLHHRVTLGDNVFTQCFTVVREMIFAPDLHPENRHINHLTRNAVLSFFTQSTPFIFARCLCAIMSANASPRCALDHECPNGILEAALSWENL